MANDDPDPQIDQRLIDEALRQGTTVAWDALQPWVESWGGADELPPPVRRE